MVQVPGGYRGFSPPRICQGGLHIAQAPPRKLLNGPPLKIDFMWAIGDQALAHLDCQKIINYGAASIYAKLIFMPIY